MTASLSNGRPPAEALGTPVVTSEGGILTGDTREISTRPTWSQVAVGIARFLADFRERQCLDAEWEFQEMCERGCGYPAAMHGLCFSCQSSSSRLPS